MIDVHGRAVQAVNGQSRARRLAANSNVAESWVFRSGASAMNGTAMPWLWRFGGHGLCYALGRRLEFGTSGRGGSPAAVGQRQPCLVNDSVGRATLWVSEV
jgi:hypothetical protein